MSEPEDLERARREAWVRWNKARWPAGLEMHPDASFEEIPVDPLFAAGWEARRGEIDALKEALRNARSYIPRGPRVRLARGYRSPTRGGVDMTSTDQRLERSDSDGLMELIRQHRRLRELLADLVEYAERLEREQCPDCPSSPAVERAMNGLAALEWRTP